MSATAESDGFGGEAIDLAEATDERLKAALAYWRSRCEGRRFPSRADISPDDMRSFLRNVMLIDVHHDPLDFVYRVFGTGISTAHGADFTGCSVRDLTPAPFARIIWRQYSEVVEAGRPLAHRITFGPVDAFRDYTRVTMPLSTDGTVVDKLLAVSDEDHAFWGADT